MDRNVNKFNEHFPVGLSKLDGAHACGYAKKKRQTDQGLVTCCHCLVHRKRHKV